MIELRCDIVEPGAEARTVIVYGYVDPPPLPPRLDGNLLTLLNEAREGNIVLGNTHSSMDSIHPSSSVNLGSSVAGASVAPPNLVPPLHLIASDDARQQHRIKVEMAHVCQLDAGGIMYELLFTGEVTMFRWLIGRKVSLMTASDQASNAS